MNTCIKIICLAVISTMTATAYGQQTNAATKYEQFKKNARQKYDDFRHKANRQYIEFLGGEWVEETVLPAPEVPRHKDVIPLTAPATPLPKIDKKIECEILPAPIVVEMQPQPLSEVEVCDFGEAQPYLNFTLYGTPCKVRFSPEQAFTFDMGAPNYAKAWEAFLTPEYDNTLADCLKLRDDMSLCDWSYKEMLSNFSEEALGKTNEAQLLLAYLYSQSGYDMRLINVDGNLMMTFSADCSLPFTYLPIEQKNYYCDKNIKGGVRVCPAGFPKEQKMSLSLTRLPHIKADLSDPKEHNAHYVSTTLPIDKNLMDFYSSYPQINPGEGDVMGQWRIFANTPMASDVKEQLYPMIKSALEGLNEVEAVNKLLDYLQYGFAYMTDKDFWGRERTFFPEETLYYPYCDCEDRAILLTRIVRDMLGLDTALVYYPGHMASAVKFNDEAVGDYLQIGDDKYYICDPTYIGGGVGDTMMGRDSQGNIVAKDNSTAKVMLLPAKS